MTRKNRLLRQMPADMDALLVTNEKNQRYLTSFDYTDGLVIVTKNKSYCLADSRYIEAAKAQVNEDFEVVLMSGSRRDQLVSILEAENVKTIGYEDASLTCEALARFSKMLSEYKLIPAGRIIEALREIKDAEEIGKIIKAQRIAEDAFLHILDFITPDRTEIDVALELEFYMRSHGAEATSFDTIAVSGSASSLPHGVPRPVKLEKGFFTMDFGALYEGYCSDMTRTVVLGKADDEMKKIYNTVLTAQLAAIEKLAVGVTGKETDKVARDIIYGAGYEGCFGHGLGHGVGMDIHEAPSNSAAGIKPFEIGHVITVEPGIYIEGKYGVRIEDMVIFDENGAQNITKSPKNLIEL